MKNSIIEELTVAISTYGERISAAKLLKEKLESYSVKSMIFHQSECEDDRQAMDDYVFITGRGVAKSRNAAMRGISSGFLWFMDDDCDIDFNELKKVCSTIFKKPGFAFYTVNCASETQGLRKVYPKDGAFHNLVSVHRFGTIEIIVDLNALPSDAEFPEDMGAGTKYPIGDEPVFLSRIIKGGKNGIHIGHTPVSHPLESSGTKKIKLYRSKLVAFKHVFGFLGYPIFVAYVFKSIFR